MFFFLLLASFNLQLQVIGRTSRLTLQRGDILAWFYAADKFSILRSFMRFAESIIDAMMCDLMHLVKSYKS